MEEEKITTIVKAWLLFMVVITLDGCLFQSHDDESGIAGYYRYGDMTYVNFGNDGDYQLKAFWFLDTAKNAGPWIPTQGEKGTWTSSNSELKYKVDSTRVFVSTEWSQWEAAHLPAWVSKKILGVNDSALILEDCTDSRYLTDSTVCGSYQLMRISQQEYQHPKNCSSLCETH